MKKSITYQSRFSIVEHVVSVRKNVSMSVMRMGVTLSKLFSCVLENHISPMQSLRLVHLIVACLFTVMPASMPLLLRLLFVAWFAITVVQLRQGEEND
ncbi:MAG: hypothetical protein IKH26_02165 [Bacteroidaceae bacterium]|nr:hypothetical protein [Bacteroidaceae bacterium]